MGYKSESTFQDDEWDNETRKIYIEYARKALGEPTDWDEDYWEDTSTKALDFWQGDEGEVIDILEKKESIREFEDADDFELWMNLYWDW